MLHWLSMLACSAASICLSASARFSDRCLSPTDEVAGQTITVAGAVAVPSLPPRPAFKPDSTKPLLEIARLSDYIPNLQFHSLIVDSRWAETNSQLTIRYLKAMVRAMQWAHANRDQAAELVSKRTGIPLKYTRATVDEYLSQGIISRDGSVNREGFQRLIDLMGERLFKSRPYPAPEKYLDMSYLRRAQQELGLNPAR